MKLVFKLKMEVRRGQEKKRKGENPSAIYMAWSLGFRISFDKFGIFLIFLKFCISFIILIFL